MVRTTIDLERETRLESESLAVEYGPERAVGLVRVRGVGGAAVLMGSPAQLRALAVAATVAAEQAAEMQRAAESLAEAGSAERPAE